MFEPKTRQITQHYATLELTPSLAQDILCALNIAWEQGYHTTGVRDLLVHLTGWDARKEQYGATIPTYGMVNPKTS